MTFERTHNEILVRYIITHPKVWPYVTDDNAPDINEFKPTIHESLCYVLAYDGAELIGMWLFSPSNSICWECHTYMLPGHGFRRARSAAQLVADWIFSNTGCQRIWTHVPVFNKIALKFAKDAGMTEFGINPASFLKNGKLVDQILLGLSKPTAPACDTSVQGAQCPQPSQFPPHSGQSE